LYQKNKINNPLTLTKQTRRVTRTVNVTLSHTSAAPYLPNKLKWEYFVQPISESTLNDTDSGSNNVHISIEEFKEKVIFHSYWWLKAKNVSFVYGCEQWRSDPLFCLGIGWCSFLYLFWQKSCILSALFSTPCALEASPCLIIYFILAS